MHYHTKAILDAITDAVDNFFGEGTPKYLSVHGFSEVGEFETVLHINQLKGNQYGNQNNRAVGV